MSFVPKKRQFIMKHMAIRQTMCARLIYNDYFYKLIDTL